MKRKEFVDVQAEGGDDEEKKETAERDDDDDRLFSLGNTAEDVTNGGVIVLPPFDGFGEEEFVDVRRGGGKEEENAFPLATADCVVVDNAVDARVRGNEVVVENAVPMIMANDNVVEEVVGARARGDEEKLQDDVPLIMTDDVVVEEIVDARARGYVEKAGNKVDAPPGIVKPLTSKKWLQKYELLVKYKEQKGSCNVPREYTGLGKWVNNVSQ